MILIALGLVFVIIDGLISIFAVHTGNKVLAYEKNRDLDVEKDKWERAWKDCSELNRMAFDVEMPNPFKGKVKDEYNEVVINKWNCDWNRINFLSAYQSYIASIKEWIFEQYGFTRETMQNSLNKRNYSKWLASVDKAKYYKDHERDINYIMSGMNERWVNSFKQSVRENVQKNLYINKELCNARRKERNDSVCSFAITFGMYIIGIVLACNDHPAAAITVWIIELVIYFVKFFKKNMKYMSDRMKFWED